MAFGALSASCASSDEEHEGPIAPVLEEIGEHVEELRSVIESHNVEVAGSQDIGPIAEIESEHHHTANEMLEDVEHKLEEASNCHDHDGAGAETEHMAEFVEEGLDAVDEHESAMGLAGTLEAALEEEDRHAAAMATILDELEAEHAELEARTSGMTCPMDDDHHEEEEGH